jgi:histidinol-phosphate aminotransferase
MKAYAPGEQINDATKLNTNECAWGPAPGVLKALSAATVDQLRLYPSPLADKVRAAAADVFKVEAASVLVGNGSDDCLTVVMRSFLGPGDVVACPWPTYSLYDTLATVQGVEIRHAQWLERPDSEHVGAGTQRGAAGWHLPVEDLLDTGAKVVFVATPNNPSATLVPLDELEALAQKLRGVLVVDEAYIDYATAADGESPAGLAASFIPRLSGYPNVIVLRTFSKSYSMAGARLGLMFASPELIGHMNKVKDSYNVNSMTQIAGEAALRDREYWEWLVRSTITERKWLLESCAQFKWTYPKTDVRAPPPRDHPGTASRAPALGSRRSRAPMPLPTGKVAPVPTAQANFVLFDVGCAKRAEYLYTGLKQQGVLVRYWGARPDLCSKLRVTVGTRDSNARFVQIVTGLLAAEGA